MIITIPWIKKHLKTKASESEIIDKLTKTFRPIGDLVEDILAANRDQGPFTTRGTIITIPAHLFRKSYNLLGLNS